MSIVIGQKYTQIPKKSLCLLLDASDTSSYSIGSDTWYDLSGLDNHFYVNPRAYTSASPKYMDFNGAFGCAKLTTGGILGLVGKEQGNATYIVWTRIKNSTTEWRTLTRGLSTYGCADHNIIIQSGGWNIGMYDNQNGSGFNDTGFSQQSLPNYASNGWNMLIFRFSSVSPFLKLSYNDTPGTIRGSNGSSNSAFKFGFNSLGAYGNDAGTDVNNANQYWGDIAWFAAWNRQLTDAECLAVYNATASRFFGTTQTYDTDIRFQDNTSQSTAPTATKGELIQINTYASAGTFTWSKPTDCSKVVVKVTGGGGGAAGYCESGGAGGYAEKEIDVSAVSSVSVTVGGGGSSTGYYAGGGNGGTSSFGSYVSASGGYGANQNASHSGGHGGVGSGGQINLYGGDGTGHANSHGYYPGGTGGGSFWGGSSTVRRDTTSTKLYSGAPGAGGPGGRTDDGGGGGNGTSNGESGIVIVYSYK